MSVNAKHVLGRLRAPDETGATVRAWTVVRAAYPDVLPEPRRRPRRRLAQALVVSAAGTVLVLSSALASVRLFTPRPVVKHVAVPAVSSLPAAGSVLVSGPTGTWTVTAGGVARRLGSYPQAAWSPHGEYVAVAQGDQLRAIDPHGRVVWALQRPAVHDPRWYASSGWRIAYRSGSQLRVVAGDGTSDRALAAGVSPVAPAWRPNRPYQLAYLRRGSLVVRDADTGELLAQARAAGAVRRLDWANDGARLLAVAPSAALIYAPGGRELASYPGPIVDAALSPDGRTLALVRGADLILEPVLARRPLARHLFSATGLRQVVWSPDGRWLLVSWPPADEWLFVRVTGAPRIVAFSHVRGQFRTWPQLEGWCCSAGGMS